MFHNQKAEQFKIMQSLDAAPVGMGSAAVKKLSNLLFGFHLTMEPMAASRRREYRSIFPPHLVSPD
jgi:hypothetical protein